MGGEERNRDGKVRDNYSKEAVIDYGHMKPVYEGYFYMIHWISEECDNKGNGSNACASRSRRHTNPAQARLGYWQLSKRVFNKDEVELSGKKL